MERTFWSSRVSTKSTESIRLEVPTKKKELGSKFPALSKKKTVALPSLAVERYFVVIQELDFACLAIALVLTAHRHPPSGLRAAGSAAAALPRRKCGTPIHSLDFVY